MPLYCHLLALLSEIRCEIWECLLVARTHYIATLQNNVNGTSQTYITFKLQSPNVLSHVPKLHLHILSTCKQIHAEAKEVFYSENVFEFDNAYGFDDVFRTSSGGLKLGLIKQMFVQLQDVPLQKNMAMIRSLERHAPNLRTPYVEFVHEHLGGWDYLAGGILEIVRAIGQIKQVERILLDGFCGMHWIEYLLRESGAEVRQWRERYAAPIMAKGFHSEEEIARKQEEVALVRVYHEKMLECWQAGTRHLVPRPVSKSCVLVSMPRGSNTYPLISLSQCGG